MIFLLSLLAVSALVQGENVAPAVSTFVTANPTASPFKTISEFGTPGKPTPSARAGAALLPAFSGNLTRPASKALAEADLFQDLGRYGPEIELVHLYFDQWPTGISVSRSGQVFTCYPRGNATYTLGTFTNETAEEPWPNLAWNTPASITGLPGYSVASNTSFIFVQSVVVDGKDRVWAMDTGRPTINGTDQLAQVPGGPKLVRFDTQGNSERAYIFPDNVVYADSSLNDVRFDLRSREGFPQGIAYLTDSSPQRAGLVIVNLESGESWRHLDNHVSVQTVSQFVPSYNGRPFFNVPTDGTGIGYFNRFAADGLALSADGEYVYYSPISSRRLYRVPSSCLRRQPGPSDPYAIIQTQQSVQDLGEKGSHSDGLETNSDGLIYLTAPENNGIDTFNPATGLVEPFIRDPRIQFPDTMSVVDLDEGSFLYFTVNQLWLGATYQNNTDLRVKPYSAFRVPISGGKATQTD